MRAPRRTTARGAPGTSVLRRPRPAEARPTAPSNDRPRAAAGVLVPRRTTRSRPGADSRPGGMSRSGVALPRRRGRVGTRPGTFSKTPENVVNTRRSSHAGRVEQATIGFENRREPGQRWMVGRHREKRILHPMATPRFQTPLRIRARHHNEGWKQGAGRWEGRPDTRVESRPCTGNEHNLLGQIEQRMNHACAENREGQQAGDQSATTAAGPPGRSRGAACRSLDR